ncbi:MAG: sigma-70 family RNA polymerase sigma factor [Bacteriovoracaceae bacterium]
MHIQKINFISDIYASLGSLIYRDSNEDKLENWNLILENVSHHGCRQSFKKLFSHFYPLIVTHLQRSGISKQVAQELAQDSMMKVWNHAKSFDPNKAAVSTWIFVIVRNTKYDYFRKLKNDPVGPSSMELYSQLDGLESESTELDMLMDISKLKNLLVNLPSEQQFILEQIYFEGMSQQEISEKHQIPLGTVKSRVRLAMGAIKKMMEDKLQ